MILLILHNLIGGIFSSAIAGILCVNPLNHNSNVVREDSPAMLLSYTYV